MKITDTEKITLALVKGNKAYEYWDKMHHSTSYMTVILYELLLRKRLTQKDLINLSNLPKQSINKGIHQLKEAGYLALEVDQADNRKKFCQLTPAGYTFAKKKMQPLFDLEEATAQRMGPAKMQQLVALQQEWSDIIWELLKEEKGEFK